MNVYISGPVPEDVFGSQFDLIGSLGDIAVIPDTSAQI